MTNPLTSQVLSKSITHHYTAGVGEYPDEGGIVACGMECIGYHSDSSTDWKKVTCKRCLKSLAKRK